VDPYYLTHKAEQVGYHPQVILAGRKINDGMAKYMVKEVIQKMLLNGINVTKSTVGVLGITFKENCPDVRNSKIIDVINELKDWGINVLVSDPWADEIEVKQNHNINLVEIEDGYKVDSLIVAVGHNEYRNLSSKKIRSLCRGHMPVLGDVKSLFDKNAMEAEGFTVFRL
jgi:UDP-N-acetyl-D-galactosamine dehydrogenase